MPATISYNLRRILLHLFQSSFVDLHFLFMYLSLSWGCKVIIILLHRLSKSDPKERIIVNVLPFPGHSAVQLCASFLNDLGALPQALRRW